MKRIPIALLTALLLFGVSAQLEAAQEKKTEVDYRANPAKLLTEVLKPLEKSKGNKAALAEVQTWLKAGVDDFAIHDFEGWQHYGLKDYENAVASFGRSLKLNPAYPDSLLGHGLSCYRASQYEQALPSFRAMKPSATRSKLIGSCYLELGRPVGSLSFLQEWRELIDAENLPDQILDCEIYLARAWELLEARDISVLHITRALEHRATSGLYLTRATYQQRMGNYDEAQADLDLAIESAKAPVFYEVKKFKYLRGAFRFQTAIDYAEQMLKKYSDNDELNKIWPQEIETLRKRIAAGEKAPALADPQTLKQDYEKAMAEKRSIAAIVHASLLVSRGHTDYHFKRAQALFNLSLPSHMLSDLDAAIAAGQKGGEVHSLRAFSLNAQANPDSDEIVKACSRAFEVGFNRRADYILRAQHYKLMQMYEKAIADQMIVLGEKLRDDQKLLYESQLKELKSLASAKKHFAPFLKPDADPMAFTKPMIPTPEIIAKVYSGRLANNFTREIAKLTMDPDSFVVRRAQDQTIIKLHAATTEQFQDTNNFPHKFPGGYRAAAKFLKPGNTFVRVRFLEPGKTAGMSYASFVQVDGNWYWFPKPWRFLDDEK